MFSAVTRDSVPVFKFCALGHVFDGTEGVGTRFHVLCTLTRFWRKRGCRVSFSCFALSESFPAVPRALGPVFKFCAPGLIFCGTAGARYCFHVLLSRICFRRYRGRPFLFSCFALPDKFSTVPRASCSDFMFCAPGHVFDGTEGVESHFDVLRVRTHFRRNRGCSTPFSYFARPDSFSSVPRVLGSVFMFCAAGVGFRVIEGVGSRFHVLRARTRFRRYRGHGVPFSCFGLPGTFLTVRRASGSYFYVLRSLSRFPRYRERRVSFSCFTLQDPFSAVPRALGPFSCFVAQSHFRRQ
jgi:hypothetical protein